MTPTESPITQLVEHTAECLEPADCLECAELREAALDFEIGNLEAEEIEAGGPLTAFDLGGEAGGA